MSRPTRDQVLAGVVAVAGRVGVARLTVDEVAKEAGVGRATVYRWFPGGREQLVDEGITWEIGRFLDRVAEATAAAPDLRTRLLGTIRVARRLLAQHEVLQRLLATEPGGVLPQLQQTLPLVVAVLRDDLRTAVAAEPRRRAGVDSEAAADWLARMVLSFTIAEGRHVLDDDAELERLVDDVLLAGLVEPAAPDDQDRDHG